MRTSAAYAGSSVRSLCGSFAVLLAIAVAAASAGNKGDANPARSQFPGIGDPGSIASLNLYAGADAGAPATLLGPEARLQLVVTSEHVSGQSRDATAAVTYRVEPAGVVEVDALGRVVPLANGTAEVTATHAEGPTGTLQIQVERFDDPPAVSFVNQVVPLFTKLGCNSGGCHGKSGGQNGFSLSLLGFEPWDDYARLVHESRGRRVFPAAPESSLLLLKATNALPHGGGQKMTEGDAAWATVRRWIAQGMPRGSEADPAVESIRVFPGNRRMVPDGKQQLKVLAFYDDGKVEDVTHATQFESNQADMASVDESGRVTMRGLPGDVSVMVRYQTHVDVFRATVPLGLKVDNLPEPANLVDERVFARLMDLGLPPSGAADDGTFIRRVTIDLAGRLPTLEESRAFLADASPLRREQLVDRLLASTDHADFFAQKWGAVLRNRRSGPEYAEGNFAFRSWLRQSIATNKPYDQMTRELLTAGGRVAESPPVAWWRQVNSVEEKVEDVAQLFLGVRIQCARCHHHPQEAWSQDDYFGFAAFFSQVGFKGATGGVYAREYRVFHRRGNARAQNPATQQWLTPRGLGAEPPSLAAEQDPRSALVDWMTTPDNPFFARVLVNRYWKHFFGRGLVEPEDDLRLTNPPITPELLDGLAGWFVESGFDLKGLVKLICTSKTYGFSAIPDERNARDRQAFSRFYPRRLEAEVLYDAIDAVCGTTTDFSGLPADMRAVQIPDHDGVDAYFLDVFGRPAASSACECERTGGASLAQSLHLVNSSAIAEKIAKGRAALMASGDAEQDVDHLNDLYLSAFSRLPDEQEKAFAVEHLEASSSDRQRAWEDIVWALMNTKEFLFNH